MAAASNLFFQGNAPAFPCFLGRPHIMTNKMRVPLIVLASVVALMGVATIWKTHRADTFSVMADPATAMRSDASLDASETGQGPIHRRRPPMGRTNPEGDAKPPTREEIAALQKERAAKAARAYGLAGQQFATQRVDPIWSAKTEQGLQKLNDNPAFAQMGAQAKDLQIECKSSLCQIKGQFANDREARDWTQIYMTDVGNLASMGRVRFYPNPDGSTQVRIYSYK